MSKLTILLVAAAIVLAAEPKQVFTGTITESMCKMNHKMTHISPDDKCVRDCVKASSGKTKYVLMGQDSEYLLSDQETPAQFAAKKVRVIGAFYPKTGVIAVERIEAVN